MSTTFSKTNNLKMATQKLITSRLYTKRKMAIMSHNKKKVKDYLEKEMEMII